LEQGYRANPNTNAAVRLEGALMRLEEIDPRRAHDLIRVTGFAETLVYHLGDLHRAALSNVPFAYSIARNTIWRDIINITRAAATSESSRVRHPVHQFLQQIGLARQI
jgi:hypothetical protein